MTIRSPHRSKLLLGCVLSLLTAVPAYSFAALPYEESVQRSADPVDISALQERQKTTETGTSKQKKDALAQEEDMAVRIRQESMKEAAFSYGARGGLAWRTHQIMITLDENAPALDKTYNFRRLLISAPSNLLIEPPIITEALNAFVVNNGGEEAAVSDAIYNISKQARIVAAPRHWRQYMERSWDEVAAPPDILLPESAAERKNWRLWIKEGWEQGVSQADDTFQSDLNRMTADFEGMIRYRNLLAQGKVSAPYAVMVDRGITGGGAQMRVGDRAVKISGQSQLINRGENWLPPERQ